MWRALVRIRCDRAASFPFGACASGTGVVGERRALEMERGCRSVVPVPNVDAASATAHGRWDVIPAVVSTEEGSDHFGRDVVVGVATKLVAASASRRTVAEVDLEPGAEIEAD